MTGSSRLTVLMSALALSVGYAPPALVAAGAGGWNGTYRYSFDGGSTVGGSGIVVSYTLVLTADTCRFTARGFQTDEDIVCTARRTPTSVAVAFRRYADGGTENQYGVALYAVGEPLFTLERRGVRVVTRWQGYSLPDEKPHAPAVYLVRAR